MNPRSTFQFPAAVTILVVLGAWIFFRVENKPVTSPAHSTATANVPPVIANTGVVAKTLPATELARREALYPSFRKHPFPVTREANAFSWTSEDGKKPDVIRQLAHNELEFERMAGEDARIYRRQLVYHNMTTDALIESSKLTGQPVSQLTLPGLDGQEVQFEITKSDLSPSGRQGAFSGHVAGRLDSMVTLAFKGGREAFTVLSPSDGIYLVGEPREPGELIVKSINPDTYVTGVCGNP